MWDDLLSPTHLVVLLILALLIFGPKRLPELGSSLGKTIRDFKHALTIGSNDASSSASLKGPENPSDTQHISDSHVS